MRLSLSAVAALSIATVAAHADTMSTTFNTGPFTTPPGFTFDVNPVTFSGFNPARGTLTSVDLSLAGSFQVVQTGNSIPGPDNSAFSVYLNATNAFGYAPNTFPLLHETSMPEDSTGTFSITASSLDKTAQDLAFFSNTGSITAYFAVEDSLNAIDQNATPNGLAGTVTYNYTPATPTSISPEPSSLALLGTGFLGLVGAARRRLA